MRILDIVKKATVFDAPPRFLSDPFLIMPWSTTPART